MEYFCKRFVVWNVFWSNCWDIIRSHIANWDFLPAEARSLCVQINKTESFYICVQRNILLIVEHKPYLHIYLHVAVTQITQTESQQHFIYYKYFYRTELVRQKKCVTTRKAGFWTAHKCSCQATRRLRRSSRSCKLFLPSQPQPSILSGSLM